MKKLIAKTKEAWIKMYGVLFHFIEPVIEVGLLAVIEVGGG